MAFLTDQGFDAAQVASAFALTGLAGLVGRPGFGWLSDRIGTTRVYAILTACLLLAIASLVVAGQTAMPAPVGLCDQLRRGARRRHAALCPVGF